ncbi:YibE/F family protein [Senegalia massiliensis]|uniref:YibE/F family protein n=1 Tax=Senegalia massiliensis TaxID=1720316 RepID=A0A845QW96_9CLOT|nr:YibE/F family protein [Senegalia massiliensis]NBI05428.1 YibE/F family protein [Senegalia massiliensis]
MDKKIFVFIILITLIFVNVNATFADQNVEEKPEPVRAKVLEILSEDEQETSYAEGETTTIQTIELEITSGENKGEKIIVENHVDSMFAYNIVVEQNDDVLVYLEKDESGEIIEGYISEIARDKYLLYLGIVFFLLLLIIGGLKGLKAIITLLITAFAVLKIMLPLILKGYNPIYLSIIISICIIAVTLVIISGFNRKALAAIIGTTGGVLVAGLITLIIGELASLTGLGTEEAQMLSLVEQGDSFNFKGILFAGIILGALGAVMDVSMSIASSINEIKTANPEMTTKQLIKSGMNVGKDIMGTMSNTLILAYSGGSIHLMLLFMAHDFNIIDIINRDMIASEILRALAGSIGLIFTVPITAIVASNLYNRIDKKTSSKH